MAALYKGISWVTSAGQDYQLCEDKFCTRKLKFRYIVVYLDSCGNNGWVEKDLTYQLQALMP